MEEETRVALVSRGALLAAAQPLDAPALRAGLEWLIDQLLLGDEAARLQVFEGDRASGAAELARFRGQFAAPEDFRAFLERCDLSEAELTAILLRSLRVKRYVESRVAHAAQVPEAEVTAWLAERRAGQGERARKEARARLAEARVAGEVKALVRDLRARADVRYLDEELRPAPTSGASSAPGEAPLRGRLGWR